MVQNVNATLLKTPNVTVTQITTGVGITQALTTIYTGGANGSKVVGIVVTNATSATQDVHLVIQSSAALIGYINTFGAPTNSGSLSTVPPTNGFANITLPTDSDGNPFVFLSSSATFLQASVTTNSSQWATGNAFYFTVFAGDF
jgi:hypothetical protein